ncbi:lipopolysaccharide biosynthesis protein [Clostridium perfringens]|uniref:lipopolysaccharide biosynthesis protein n=1 Tax=Clostridium perfringens TaxID=1502 RepID=UPI0018E46B9A|nr:oligosaccharide flippase family protein [Clostridium perfringens]MBI5995333.1 oligosaccharide flippase family protein [Clostridium perfringens]
MKKLKLSKDSIWNGIIYMGLGTVLAQLINVILQPILTRIIPTEQLGIYTYIISLANIVIPIASLKMDMLVVSEKDENQAQLITDLSIYIILLVSVVYLIIIFIGYFLPNKNMFNKYGSVIFIIPLLVFTNGMRFLFISYNNRYKEYKVISLVAIVREAMRAVFQVGSGLITGGAFWQILGYGISPLIGLRLQMKKYKELKKIRKILSFSQCFDLIKNKGYRQITYLVPAQFINSFSTSIITISITNLFSATTLGYYSAGVRLLEIPMIFITANVSKVCYQKISENVSKKKTVMDIILPVTIIMAVISLCGFGILYIIAPVFSELVFGNGYSIAGTYIRCFCIMYAVRLLSGCFTGICTIFNKQSFELIINIILLAVAGSGYLLGNILRLDIYEYLRYISIGYTFVYLILLGQYLYLCLKHDKLLIYAKEKEELV